MDEHFASFPDMPVLWVTSWFDWYPRTINDGRWRGDAVRLSTKESQSSVSAAMAVAACTLARYHHLPISVMTWL